MLCPTCKGYMFVIHIDHKEYYCKHCGTFVSSRYMTMVPTERLVREANRLRQNDNMIYQLYSQEQL